MTGSTVELDSSAEMTSLVRGLQSRPAMRAYLLIAAVAGLLLTGCSSELSSGFSQYYEPNEHLNPATQFAPHTAPAKVLLSTDLVKDCTYFKQSGYVVIGLSSFYSNIKIDQDDMQDKANEVQADILLWSYELIDSRSGMEAAPVFVPGANSTSFINGNTNGVPFAGTATTQTAPTVGVQYVPVTVNTYRYTGVFWRKSLAQ
jgi:hypothetical protein